MRFFDWTHLDLHFGIMGKLELAQLQMLGELLVLILGEIMLQVLFSILLGEV